MKFKFIIKKWANFYFFVQNLSEWHFSNRKSYNQYWKGKLGPLSKEEKKALKKIKQIHSKYGFGGQYPYLGRFFYLRKNPWKTLEKQLAKRELIALKNIFSVFQPKFEILWKKDLPLLKKWKKKLQKEVNKKSLITPINNTLSALYNTPPLNKDFRAYLLFSTPTGLGGTANLKKNQAITLDLSKYPLKKINIAMAMLWHEMTHAYFETYYFLPMLIKKFPQDKKTIELIKEATVRSLFPYGILGKRFFGTKKWSHANLRHPGPLIKLTQQYFREDKVLDEEYIEKSLSILSGFKGFH